MTVKLNKSRPRIILAQYKLILNTIYYLLCFPACLKLRNFETTQKSLQYTFIGDKKDISKISVLSIATFYISYLQQARF